eukprot:g1944.t1
MRNLFLVVCLIAFFAGFSSGSLRSRGPLGNEEDDDDNSKSQKEKSRAVDHASAVMNVYHLVHQIEEKARLADKTFPTLLLDTTRERLAAHLEHRHGDAAAAAAVRSRIAATRVGDKDVDGPAVAHGAGDVVQDVLKVGPGQALSAADGGGSSACAGLCKCLASEFLFGASNGTLPYHRNYDAGSNGKFFQYASVKGTTPLWYRRDQGHWKWTPSDPAPSMTDFIESGWTQCSAQEPADVNGGVWGLMQSGGLAEVAKPNKMLIRVLGSVNPDAAGSPPPGSDSTKHDARYDLSLCAARNSLDDLKKCECRSDACVKALVPKYFQYIQVVEETAVKVANFHAIKNWVLDALSIGLDLLGLLEPVGIVFDLINVGLAFLRGLWVDGVIGVVCAIPAIGSPFLAAKWASKGVLKGSSKFMARMVDLLKYLEETFTAGHIVFKQFADELATAASKAGSHLDTLKNIGKSFKRMGSSFWFLMTEGRKVADEVSEIAVDVAKNPSKLKQLTARVAGFVKDVLMRVGCGSSKAHKWMFVVFGKLGLAFEYFDAMKVVGEWMQAIAPCLEACSSGASPAEIIQGIETCALEVGGEVAKKLNPCWEEKGPGGEMPLSADPAFKIELRKPSAADQKKVDDEVEAALDTFKCECTAQVDKILETDGDSRGAPKESEMVETANPRGAPDRGAIATFALKLAGSPPPMNCSAEMRGAFGAAAAASPLADPAGFKSIGSGAGGAGGGGGEVGDALARARARPLSRRHNNAKSNKEVEGTLERLDEVLERELQMLGGNGGRL